MLNIPSTVVDSNYRYQMPKMQLKIESKGNGIKTNIVNLPDVGKHLRINQIYILKYFGFEKATQITEKASEAKSKQQGKSNRSFIIQGEFTEAELLKVLDKFIDKYVLCPKCKLPEMHLFIDKDRIQGKCDSCPFNGEIDNKHKLTAYILKNPPEHIPQAAKRNQQKVIKVEESGKEEATNIAEEDIQKKEETKASEIFSAQTINFGGEELEELIKYTKKLVEDKKKDDFDICCAEIVADLKPIGLKKPFYAYVLFNTFFSINIHKQVEEHGKMYLHLMKKLAAKESKQKVAGQSSSKALAIEIQTILNLEYLYLQAHKDKDFSKAIPTILMKLHEAEIFSDQFIKIWSKNEIVDVEKMFMYNQERDEKFKELAKDFIDYINDEDQEEDKEES